MKNKTTSSVVLNVGDKAPDFRALAVGGKYGAGREVSLADFRGKKLVLYFYPKDDTPGCTKEACSFRDNLPKFRTHKAVVLGISGQSEASKAKFAKKYDLSFPLLAGENYEVAEKYGVWQKKLLYGRTFMGVSRTTYLIGPDGKVARRWDKVKVESIPRTFYLPSIPCAPVVCRNSPTLRHALRFVARSKCSAACSTPSADPPAACSDLDQRRRHVLHECEIAIA